MLRRKKRIHAQGTRALIARAARSITERLEGRCLLSAVTTFPIPGQSADTFNWNGSSHLVNGPDGNLWFTDGGNNQVDRVTPQGQITQFSLPTADSSPDDIVAGSDGNLWFTESGADQIGRITPAGVVTEYATPTTGSSPTAIAVGSDGNLWFAESGTNDIGRITRDGTVTEFPTTNLDLSSTDEMVKAPGGDVWFVAFDSNGDNEIAKVNTAGKVTAYSLNSYPADLTVGPDGNLYVAASGEIDQVTASGTVTPFTIPDGSDAYAITTGPDGALWFGSDGTNQMGRMTTSGTFSFFALPEPGATDGSTVSVGALAKGPDNNLWFVDDQTPQVGFVNLSDALLASADSPTVTAGTTSSATLASFTDLSGGSTASDYSATITWNDGTTSSGTIAANSSGGFDVSATRDWSLDDDSATVTIVDNRDATRTAVATPDITVNPPAATGTGVTVSATAGQLFTGTVATFTGVALNSLLNYSATIDWGDGQVSDGTITANSSGGIDITSSTRYAASGAYTVTVDLSPWPGGFLYPLGGGSGVAPVALGGPVSKTVANGPAATALAGKIAAHAQRGASPPANASASTPAAAASSAVKAGAISAEPLIPIDPLPPVGDGYATATSTATMAAGVMNGTGYTIQASSAASFSGDVASFTLTDPNADISHFHATVTWSDPWVFDWFTCGATPVTGTITSNGNGGFTVSVASVDFPNFGLTHFTVSITDDRITGGDATVGVAYGQLSVDSPIHWLPVLESGGTNSPVTSGRSNSNAAAATNAASSAASNVNPALSEQPSVTSSTLKSGPAGTVRGTIGVLTGLTAVKNLAALHGAIDWGDGTTSPATFVKGGKGRILVIGTHRYSEGGTFNVSTQVLQTLYDNGKASALYPMALPEITSTAKVMHAGPITTGGIAISAVAGQPFSGSLASFTIPSSPVPVTRTTTIFWGDGVRSIGTIGASGSDLTIAGTHTYRKAGKYHVHVVVTQKSTQRGVAVPLVLANIATTATVTAT